MHKFDRSLGTSKRAQGVVTPKDENAKNYKKGVEHMWMVRLEKAGIQKKKVEVVPDAEAAKLNNPKPDEKV